MTDTTPKSHYHEVCKFGQSPEHRYTCRVTSPSSCITLSYTRIDEVRPYKRTSRSSRSSKFLYCILGLLMVDSLIELSFISSMVSFLHRRAGGSFAIEYDGGTLGLHGKPLHLLVNQGHTSNGAAGTAFILVGLGGILVFSLLARCQQRAVSPMSRYVAILHHVWMMSTVLSCLLTLAALIYTFIVTHQTNHQSIDLATTFHSTGPLPSDYVYTVDKWTPETWLTAMRALPLIYDTERSSINTHLAIMRGWRWNLIPMFILGVGVCGAGIQDALARRSTLRFQRLQPAKVVI